MPYMFINLTNHPSAHWGEEQISAASQYGEIVDWPFPTVQPSASQDDILRFAEDVYSDVIDVYGNKIAAAHIMGEFTLCYALVQLFKASGITCLASTTDRVTTVNPDGSKTSMFKFVQFREY